MDKSTQNFDEIGKKLKQVEEMLKDLRKNCNKLNEEWHKLNKCKCKCKYIKKMSSGFANPTRIPDELYEFLQREKRSKLPRTKEVGEKIYEYIRKYNLRICGTHIGADGIRYWIAANGERYWI